MRQFCANYRIFSNFSAIDIVPKRLHVSSFNLSWSLVFLLNSTRVFATQSIMKENPENPEKAASIYEFVATDIDGNVIDFESYRDNVLVIVNVASKCGYTSKHITELNELHTQFYDKGLRILGFPCNQFSSQEPGTCPIIKDFNAKHGVQYKLFDKVNVNGKEAHPIFKFLKAKQGGTLLDAIKWNFTKFIVDRNGIPVARFAATTSPKGMKIEDYL